MNIGDKVRFLRGTEEGVVSKLLDRNLVEVEIEDGFAIPVLQSELVVVSADEGSAFNKPSHSAAIDQNPYQKSKQIDKAVLKGFHLALIPLNDQLCSIYFLNPASTDILLMVNEINGKEEEKTICSEKVFARHASKITEGNMNHISTWNTFSITILQETNQWSIPIRPLKKTIKLRAKHFQKDLKPIEILNKNGYLISLNPEVAEAVEPTAQLDIEQLKNSFYEPKDFSPIEKLSQHKFAAATEVDLHIEAIDSNYENLPKEDILRIQMEIFERKLDQAIASGIGEIIFVHGVGNGILRNSIHKSLSGHQHVQFFKDAQKEKFGYGATLVKIK